MHESAWLPEDLVCSLEFPPTSGGSFLVHYRSYWKIFHHLWQGLNRQPCGAVSHEMRSQWYSWRILISSRKNRKVKVSIGAAASAWRRKRTRARFGIGEWLTDWLRGGVLGSRVGQGGLSWEDRRFLYLLWHPRANLSSTILKFEKSTTGLASWTFGVLLHSKKVQRAPKVQRRSSIWT